VDIYGNYMGYMDFNGVRYLDTRETSQFYYPISPVRHPSLPSDSTKRQDSIVLARADMKEAQLVKEQLEELQRKDRRIREHVEKRRDKGGKKFDF